VSAELKATPGPWSVVGDTQANPLDPDSGEAYIVIQTPNAAFDLLAPGCMTGQHAANAHLIAAAPDLYAALAAFLNPSGDVYDCIRAARVALKKARGEQ
jgi:hypothetical protein